LEESQTGGEPGFGGGSSPTIKNFWVEKSGNNLNKKNGPNGKSGRGGNSVKLRSKKIKNTNPTGKKNTAGLQEENHERIIHAPTTVSNRLGRGVGSGSKKRTTLRGRKVPHLAEAYSTENTRKQRDA